jgi:hypothetical protein
VSWNFTGKGGKSGKKVMKNEEIVKKVTDTTSIF